MRIYFFSHRGFLGKLDQEDMGEAESKEHLANAEGLEHPQVL